ncbi:maleylacetoacetate isomerase [soil metagenome]
MIAPAPMPLLHGYWRSSAAYRVRIALNLKGIDYAQVTHDLRTGAQSEAAYRAIAPQGLVPALEEGDAVITQSPAILEWIEERWPSPRLLPIGLLDRAEVRAMMNLIVCDIHPLNNLRVLNVLRGDLAASPEQVQAWIARWIGDGFSALETMIWRAPGAWSFGDSPTLADCCLIPQVYGAQRFGIDLSAYPRITAIAAHADMVEAFAAAHPARQPDAD